MFPPKCHIDRDPIRRHIKIYLWRESPGGNQYIQVNGPDSFINHDIPQAGVIDPFITLPEDWLRAIIEATSDLKQPTPATQAHLEDAITVRDRLLTMVERGQEQN